MGKVIREDKQKMSALYTYIVNCIVAELPSGWTNMGLCFAVDEKEYQSFLIYYSTDGGATYRDLVAEAFEAEEPVEGLFDAKEGCQDLFDLCKASGDRWTQFSLCVDAMGEFTADYNYDALEAFSPLHEQIWRGRYLKKE